jgi:hypothetical protein
MLGLRWVRPFPTIRAARHRVEFSDDMSTPELNEDFLDMLDALLHEHVDFVVVGAHALAAHGLPRATGDIDIFVRPAADNALRVMNALARFGAPTAAHGIRASDFETPGNVYQIGLPPRRIDLLTEISGVRFDEAAANAITVRIASYDIPVLGRNELIKNKRAAARDKDLIDANALEAQKK